MKLETTASIYNFIIESNRIEGVIRAPTVEEIAEYERFMGLEKVDINDLMQFVRVYQPGAVIRDRSGLDVRIGNHIAPAGGMAIVYKLGDILHMANDTVTPYEIHQAYENLHPFTDGNGRSGRMLWKWMMLHKQVSIAPLGFLHTWYYQSLDNWRK